MPALRDLPHFLFWPLAISMPLLLQACATAPSAPQCPPPVQELKPARAPLGQPFQNQMQRFLSGLLPEQTN